MTPVWNKTVGEFYLSVSRTLNGGYSLESKFKGVRLTHRIIPPWIANDLTPEAAAWGVITDCQVAVYRLNKSLDHLRP